MRSSFMCVALLAAASSHVAARQNCPGAPSAYSMTILPEPWAGAAGDLNRAYGINNHGDVVGQSGISGMSYSSSTGISRNRSGLNRGICRAINDDGWIGGGLGFWNFQQHDPVLFGPNDEIVILTEPQYPGGFVGGLNNSGDSVGRAFARPQFGECPVIWRNSGTGGLSLVVNCGPDCCGSQQEAWDVNDNERIVGMTHTCPRPGELRAYFRDSFLSEPVYIDLLPGHLYSIATSVNNNGDVVGHAWNAASQRRAFIRTTDGVITPLGTLPDADSYAWCVNESRVVVGGVASQAVGRGWRWTLETGMVDLNTLWSNPDPAWTIVEARGVNDSGQIAATIRHVSDGRTRAVLLSPLTCAPDWNCDGAVTSSDFFEFLGGFFKSDADFNADGATDSQDFFDFLDAFFVGC